LDFETMRRTIEAGDEEEFHRQMHTLKGVAGNLGVMKTYASAEELLVELRAHKLENVDLLKKHLAKIEQECKMVCDVLEEYQAGKD
ncbi:MAG: Hpt domain-containing protein, partial [Oscillospiraceae bacterium]|nr:Hpt domain-containing protein [Oscillospiraceae bacterium]